MLTDAQVLEVHRLASEGVPQLEIGSRFGIAQQSVQSILAGRSYKHVRWDGPPPKYRGEAAGGRRRISEETRDEIRRLLANGGSTGAVAAKTGVSQAFVWRMSRDHV